MENVKVSCRLYIFQKLVVCIYFKILFNVDSDLQKAKSRVVKRDFSLD